MAFLINELLPPTTKLVLNGLDDIALKPLSLKLEVEISEQYGGVNEMFRAIAKDPQIIFDVLWLFVADQKRFYTRINFKKSLLGTGTGTDTVAMKVLEAIQINVTRSMPLIKNQRRWKELQEIRKQTEGDDNEPCYAVYFDQIAARYGYTIEQFSELTLRQLHMILKTMDGEKYKELEVQAALQGKKMKPRMLVDTEITEEQENEQDQQAVDFLAQARAEYEKKKKDSE